MFRLLARVLKWIVVAQSGGYRVCFSAINLFLSVGRVEFEMPLSKQRKIDSERRVFQDKWTDRYFFIAQKGNPVCLVCSEMVEVTKEYNLKRHCLSKYGNYTEYSSGHGSSHEVSDITLTPSQSRSAAANQLDIFPFAANPN